ncbi:MAG: hypothetical protein KAJ10_16085 [Thermodesulfovibrionia bacterium]|nr:hypothetical protein [Thermodesulfovibrionia bacterium]
MNTETLPRMENQGDNSEINRNVVLYHAECLDGFGAAYAVWYYMMFMLHDYDCKFIPCQYGNDLPWKDIRDCNVYFVDFSCGELDMHRMLISAASITVLDHHKTAYQELQPFFDSKVINGVFDMEKSGAILAWEWFFDSTPPEMLFIIQDRDLWEWKFQRTKAVTAALWYEERSFEHWKNLIFNYKNRQPLLEATGKVLLHAQKDEIDRACKQAWDIKIFCPNQEKYITIPVTNCHKAIYSDVGHELAEKNGWGVSLTYRDDKGKRIFSLRRGNGVAEDVSEIARYYGGGGHAAAAGFEMEIDDLMSNVITAE